MPNNRRIRWDRVSIAAVLLIILIFIFGSCMQRCSDDSEQQTTPPTDSSGASSAEESVETSLPAAEESAASSSTTSSASVNLPVVVTDAAVTEAFIPESDSVDTTATEAVSSGGFTMPENYQALTLSAEDVHKGSLIVVNSDYPCQLEQKDLDLAQVYFAEDKPDTYEVSYPGHTALDSTALTQFNRLMKAYFGATSNREIMFNYGWLEAGKEHSNPDSPTALDIQLHVKRDDGGYEYVENKAPYAWLFEHMASYGYILRYPENKSDFTGERGGYTAIRYVGVPHAAYMTDNGLCLEEYIDLLRREYSFTKAMLEYSTTELTYQIYYFPANSSGTTEIPVPKTGAYEVSGNNVDGFIVTVVVG